MQQVLSNFAKDPTLSTHNKDFEELDKALKQMKDTHDTNIQAMETFIDIFKKKKKNLNSNSIKAIYKMFSENRANQIFCQKQAKVLLRELDEKSLQRYYSRVIELGIRKISFFWLNSASLGFLSSYTVNFMRQLHSCFNNPYKRKNLKSHFKFLKLLFIENTAIEDKIYKMLVDDGYLSSMDEFYRINGIGLVQERSYGRKKRNRAIISEPNDESSDDQEDIETYIKQISKNSKATLKKERKYQRTLTPSQIDRNLKKIKGGMQSLLSAMKERFNEEEDKRKMTEIIKQCKAEVQPTKKQLSEQVIIQKKIKKKEKRFSRRISIMIEPRVSIKQRSSIELMSYFSNEFKSVINNTNQNSFDLDCLSDLIITTERNKFRRRTTNHGSNQNHAQMMEEINRSRLIDLISRKNSKQVADNLFDNLSEAETFNRKSITKKESKFHPKFSFKSAPGGYLTFNQDSGGRESSIGVQSVQKKRGFNKFRIKPNYHQEQIFQNQTILNEFATNSMQKNQRTMPVSNLMCGSVGMLAIGFDTSESFRLKKPVKRRLPNKNQHLSLTMEDKKTNRVKFNIDNRLSTANNKKKKPPMENASHFPLYTVFDRARRKIVMVK